METALLIADIIAKLGPTVVDVVVLLRRQDGSIAVLTVLDEAEAKFDENIRRALEVLKAKGVES